MWGDPGCPGHPDVEAQVDETLRRVVESEALNETPVQPGFTRRRPKYKTDKWLFDNQIVGRLFFIPVLLILLIEALLVDPRAVFTLD